VKSIRISWLRSLLITSLIGLAYWLFGNLYEAIVIGPNWVVESPMQMKRLHEFFVNTSPTIYFVPITQVAVVLVWVVYFANSYDVAKPDLKWASLFALLATMLNIFIVSTIIVKLFAEDFMKYGEQLSVLTTRWNILNVFRMTLTAATIWFLFAAYRKLDKL
jgi:hypothetical protein